MGGCMGKPEEPAAPVKPSAATGAAAQPTPASPPAQHLPASAAPAQPCEPLSAGSPQAAASKVAADASQRPASQLAASRETAGVGPGSAAAAAVAAAAAAAVQPQDADARLRGNAAAVAAPVTSGAGRKPVPTPPATSTSDQQEHGESKEAVAATALTSDVRQLDGPGGAASITAAATEATGAQQSPPGQTGDSPGAAASDPTQQQPHYSTPAAATTAAAAAPAGGNHTSNGSGSGSGGKACALNSLSASSGATGGICAKLGTWDKAKMLFSLMRPDELLNDLHDLKYIGAGGYGKVFKAVWRSAPVAIKLVPSHSPELFKSSSYKEALLCKELCHPNIVQTYETRCAQLTDEFVHLILSATTPLGQTSSGLHMSGSSANAQSYGSQEFVSGDGFGLPSPVPGMMVRGKRLPEAAAKWKDILYTTGAKAGDYLTVIIMDFCDYGSLVRPIAKGMFRPFSASGSDREARVRYRALLRTAKEIAQGLEHLHSLRVVHGDLKPGNVLLKGSRVDVRGFNAQVIDFGLSHMVNNSNPQRVSKAGGTLVYAAPEVFSGVVGKAADVYSLGIILWEMVTGSQPYKDLNEGQIVLGVQKNGLRPAWPPGQLPQLQELYEKCVAQDIDARPKAKEVVQFLTRIEIDLRAELRAAQKRQQQQGEGAAPMLDQAQLLEVHQHAMAALQQVQAQATMEKHQYQVAQLQHQVPPAR